MALLPNGLETIELGSTGWRDVINANLYKMYTKTEIEAPNYDHTYVANNQGPVLTDRSTGTQYRLYVNNGTLDIEAI